MAEVRQRTTPPLILQPTLLEGQANVQVARKKNDRFQSIAACAEGKNMKKQLHCNMYALRKKGCQQCEGTERADQTLGGACATLSRIPALQLRAHQEPACAQATWTRKRSVMKKGKGNCNERVMLNVSQNRLPKPSAASTKKNSTNILFRLQLEEICLCIQFKY